MARKSFASLLASSALKERCGEVTAIKCGFCGEQGSSVEEWSGNGNACPVCSEGAPTYLCVRCGGQLDALSLGSEHPCLSVQRYQESGVVAFEAEARAAKEAAERLEVAARRAQEVERRREEEAEREREERAERERRSRSSSILWKVIVGLVIGALLVYIFTPNNPEKLRGEGFQFQESTLSPDTMKKLDEIVVVAKSVVLEVIIVVGHSDRIENEAGNHNLSEKRALAAKEYLASKGVPVNRIYTEGNGNERPVTKPGQCGPGRSAKVVECLGPDRRVDIEIVGTRKN